MTETLVTSFSPAGERLYGLRMVQSVRQHWPASTTVVVYVDGPSRVPAALQRRTADLADWMACRRRWAGDPTVQGKSTPTVPRSKPYSYRWDAYRFAVKLFVMRDAALRMGAGILTWLDGDTLTTRAIPAGWAASLLGDAAVAYLGRGSMHPETGYVGFRLPEALPLLEWCCDAYSSDRFRALHGWTDCHILRAGIETVAVPARDLTGHRYDGHSHIWPVSPLASYVTHFKGAQKRGRPRRRVA